jgi:hypothetical protein
MEAEFPGEFIHMIIQEMPTLLDGKVIMFISVDNYSRFCFSIAVPYPLTFESLQSHLDAILFDISAKHPGTIPTFIMAYGKEFEFRLASDYRGKAYFRFDSKLANEIAQPVSREFKKHLNRKTNNN